MKSYKINQDDDFFAITANVFRLWRPCLNALKLNLNIFLLLALVPIILLLLLFGLVIAPVAVYGHFSAISIISLSVLGVLLVVALLFVWPSMVLAQLDSVRGKHIELKDLLKRALKFVLPFIGLSILIGAITLAGFILFIIPGFLAIFFLSMAVYVYADKKPKLTEAIKQSYQITKANWRLVFAVFVVNVILSLFGWIPYIGSLINMILSVIYFCLPALIYLQIRR